MWAPYIDRLATNHRQTIRYGIVTNAFDETTGLARGQVQLSDLETYDDVPHVQHYGLASSPPIGAATILHSASGEIAAGIVVGTHDPRYRPTGMQPGEVQLHDNKGNAVYLSAGADGLVVRAAGNVTIIAPSGVEIRGDLHVKGKITADNDVIAGSKGVSLINHEHQARGPTSITSPPV